MQQTTTEIQSAKIPFAFEMEENGADSEGVKTHLWTQEEYYRMGELGFFDGKRVELIEGEIFEMTPMKSLHMTGISLAGQVLREVFTPDFLVREQGPMSFNEITEPEPDIAVVKGKIRDFTDSHPKTALLIVEVSHTTLYFDRTKKASLYAKNKIQDYWILNLRDRRLEIYRRPIKDKNAFYGFSYAEISVFTEKDTVSPLAMPNAKIKVT
ncbi:MAG TPA: Uma2 family endonuclease, partial [Pyrinomonadaceae bacterium]|nr:Uma2 family endonuclease [Pyrinomonadaceae bacterium]